MNLKLAWSLLAETFAKWNEHKAIRMGAALAYFGIFAIAPVLIIAIAIAGLALLAGGMAFGAETKPPTVMVPAAGEEIGRRTGSDILRLLARRCEQLIQAHDRAWLTRYEPLRVTDGISRITRTNSTN